MTVGRSVALALAVAALGLAACGDDEATDSAAARKATTLAITTADAAGKRFTTTAPESIEGGLVKLAFTNAAKGPHEAQLVRIDGAHTPREALEVFTADGAIAPWLHFEGGAGTTGPGQTLTSTLNLEPGRYAMLDNADFMGPPNSARGALATFEVTAGDSGALPTSSATITAFDNDGGQPEYGFEVSGLKVGRNRLRFENKGPELHHVIMLPMLPGRSLADVEQALASERPSGPPPVDFAMSAGTSALDAERTQVTDLQLRRPGAYALVCFISDRDGKGKPHFQRGMLKQVEVR